MVIDKKVDMKSVRGRIERFIDLARDKVMRLAKRWDPSNGSPVFTRAGKYAARGWTDWTQGFQFGCQILLFDATGDAAYLAMGRQNTLRFMPPHVSHIGVHDHGFNTLSTYGNLRRLAREGRSSDEAAHVELYELAIKVSGAVQAARWTQLNDGSGFIYSFNGPHSLFCDTIRTCRVLILAHQLGHYLMGENDRKVSLLDRAVQHAANTARYNVYYGEGRDLYDARGRVAHESLFNVVDGVYRCPSTQQGYSPFTTWTRGLAWIILGYAELIESLDAIPEADLSRHNGRDAVKQWMLRAAVAASDYYLAHTPSDGIPYWDTGAPGLIHLAHWTEQPAQPDNPYEPVDSSAAAIAAQGLLRLGHVLGKQRKGSRYYRAGLAIAGTLFSPPYLSEQRNHEGLILHSVYHRPRNWDYVPRGKRIPYGEASMWGDYHALELAVYLLREAQGRPYLAFHDPQDS